MAAHSRPRAVLTDDHPVVLEAIRSILESDFEIVAVANSGMQALEAVIAFQPELLVLDIAMPGWNGFEVAERVLERSTATKVLFVSIYEDIDYLDKARALGASYVFKRCMRTDLLKAALATLRGSVFCSSLRLLQPK